jgi:hypothetical protein
VGQYADADDVKRNFELEGEVTDPEINDALSNADDMVHARLEADGISTPWTGSNGQTALKLAAVAFARADLRRLKSDTMGPGMMVRSVKEGDTTFRFHSPDTMFESLFNEGQNWMGKAVNAILGGNIYIDTGPIGSRSDE